MLVRDAGDPADPFLNKVLLSTVTKAESLLHGGPGQAERDAYVFAEN